jgi:hypothetical protein
MSSTVSPRGDVGATGELARRGSKTRIKVRVRKSSSGRVANDGALLDLSDENTNEVDAALSKSSSSAGMASLLVTDVEDAPLRRMRVESTHLHVRTAPFARCPLVVSIRHIVVVVCMCCVCILRSRCRDHPMSKGRCQFFTFFSLLPFQ